MNKHTNESPQRSHEENERALDNFSYAEDLIKMKQRNSRIIFTRTLKTGENRQDRTPIITLGDIGRINALKGSCIVKTRTLEPVPVGGGKNYIQGSEREYTFKQLKNYDIKEFHCAQGETFGQAWARAKRGVEGARLLVEKSAEGRNATDKQLTFAERLLSIKQRGNFLEFSPDIGIGAFDERTGGRERQRILSLGRIISVNTRDGTCEVSMVTTESAPGTNNVPRPREGNIVYSFEKLRRAGAKEFVCRNGESFTEAYQRLQGGTRGGIDRVLRSA